MSNSETPLIIEREDHCISRNNIDQDALKIIRRLQRYNHKAYLVGGSVRDILLGKEPKDFDIATDATPKTIRSLFRNSRIIGKRFKIAHIYFHGGKIIEVTTFREEAEEIENKEDNKDLILRKDNEFGSEKSDAFRRDITINALYYNPENFTVVDYVGGLKDLENRIIRIIGDPQSRFIEDPVRILRVIRHACRANCSIEKKCSKSISQNRELISHIPQSRLYEEFKKDLVSGCYLEIARKLNSFNLLNYFMPSISLALESDSDLAITICKFDSLMRKYKNPPLTLIFSLFALHNVSKENNFHKYFEEKNSKEDISEITQNSFKHILVPKKEKERITALLHSTSKIIYSWIRTAEVKRIPKSCELNLIIDFIDLINIHGQYDSLQFELNAINSKPNYKKSKK